MSPLGLSNIRIDKERNNYEQNRPYKLIQWKKKEESDILNDISENSTLVQLMYTGGSVNHAVSIDGLWIYDSK